MSFEDQVEHQNELFEQAEDLLNEYAAYDDFSLCDSSLTTWANEQD